MEKAGITKAVDDVFILAPLEIFCGGKYLIFFLKNFLCILKIGIDIFSILKNIIASRRFCHRIHTVRLTALHRNLVSHVLERISI